jgi:hypothetical protein
MEASGQFTPPTALPPDKQFRLLLIRETSGPTAKLDTALPAIEPRIVQPKAWTLYRLHCSGSRASINVGKKEKCLFFPGAKPHFPFVQPVV